MRIHQFDDVAADRATTAAEYKPIVPAGDASGEGEAKLEEWLNAAPEAILDESLLLFARQPSLSTGIPDLVGLDQYGNIVVVEIKCGESGSESASEGSIISQPQLYAQALDQYDYNEFNDIYTEYRSGSWAVQNAVADNESLLSAFNEFFDVDQDPWELNQSQRLVIVAESITQQTRDSTRWLRDRGLNIQCVEVQRFQFPSGATGFGAVTIVDYDESRSQTAAQSKPGDRVFTTNVFTRAFPEIRDLLSVESIDPVLGNLATNYPYLETRADGHPDSVRYALRVNPYDDHEIKVAIDAAGSSAADADLLRESRETFEHHGFAVSSRKSMRIVVDTWEIDSVEDLRQAEFIHRVAERYAELVTLGHQVLTSR
ncbi:PDDEXK family nuclease [Haloarcula amylovorans]|uniref:hypothetical protein n=1 Tax=Haloarcula amylovorans TaxID=2562280 RepID=UPI00107663C8|nr:hypothetical protein [Halomicroarcula amylolytica]